MNKSVILKDFDGNNIYPKIPYTNVFGIPHPFYNDVVIFFGEGAPSQEASDFSNIKVNDIYIDISISSLSAPNRSIIFYRCTYVNTSLGVLAWAAYGNIIIAEGDPATDLSTLFASIPEESKIYPTPGTFYYDKAAYNLYICSDNTDNDLSWVWINKFDKVYNAPAIESISKGNSIVLKDSAEETIPEIKIMGKSIQNGTPTIDNPIDIVDTTAESIDIRNKNIFDYSEVSKDTLSKAKCTTSVQNNEISLTCTSSGRAIIGKTYSSGDVSDKSKSIILPIKEGSAPRISFKNNVFTLAVIYFFDKNNNYMSSVSTASKPNFNTIIAPANTDYAALALAVDDAVAETVYTDSVQIEYNNVTEYIEPVTPQTTALSKTLRGIPVASNGNYTDPSGQQWYCDTIEKYKDGTGKYIQRLFCMVAGDYSYAQVTKGSETGNNTFSVRWNTTYQTGVKIPSSNNILKGASLYSHGVYGSIGTNISSITISSSGSNVSIKYGVTLTGPSTTEAFETWFTSNTPVVIYPMETPIETQLTAEELAQLDLSTYKPITTINSTPDVEITYVADTKNYIDNKFKELQNAIISQGGNV